MKNLHWWLVLACVPLYGFWTMPYLNDKRPALQKAIAVEESQQADMQKTMIALKNQQKELSTTENPPTDAVPVVLEQEYIIQDLRRITQSNGFSTTGFSFAKGQNADTKSAQMTITFSAKGKKENLIKLLQSVESNERFLALKDLSFNASQTSPGLINVNFNLYTLAQRF